MSREQGKKMIFYAVLVVLQFFLIRFLADKQIIATLFSAGAKVHVGPAVAALAFVALRLFIVLFLPGLLACELLEWVFNAREQKQIKTPLTNTNT